MARKSLARRPGTGYHVGMPPLPFLVLPLLAAGALAAEPTFEQRLGSIESQARAQAEEAKRPKDEWRTSLIVDPAHQRPGYAICRFEYSRAVELTVLSPQGKTLDELGVEVREQTRKVVEFVFPTALPKGLDAQTPAWTLRLRERRGEVVRDIRIRPDGPAGPGEMRLGSAAENGEGFELQPGGANTLSFDNSMLVYENDQSNITFPFFSRRRLQVTCRHPAPK